MTFLLRGARLLFRARLPVLLANIPTFCPLQMQRQAGIRQTCPIRTLYVLMASVKRTQLHAMKHSSHQGPRRAVLHVVIVSTASVMRSN
jgi:hypothetical protein